MLAHDEVEESGILRFFIEEPERREISGITEKRRNGGGKGERFEAFQRFWKRALAPVHPVSSKEVQQGSTREDAKEARAERKEPGSASCEKSKRGKSVFLSLLRYSRFRHGLPCRTHPSPP